MEAMQVYHLTIQENGHSRRFVYEDHDEALKLRRCDCRRARRGCARAGAAEADR